MGAPAARSSAGSSQSPIGTTSSAGPLADLASWYARAIAPGTSWRASGQMPPHGILARQALELAPGQKRLERDLAAVLLADDDHKRGAAVARVGDRVDRVAETGGRVQIDERGLAAGKCVAGRHPDHGSFVQAEHEPDVGRQIGQKRDLGRAGIAEDRRQSVAAHDIEGGIAHGQPGHRPAAAVGGHGGGRRPGDLGHSSVTRRILLCACFASVRIPNAGRGRPTSGR